MLAKTKDGLNVYYEVQGKLDSDKCIVFLNGLSQSTLSWILVTPYFKNDHKIVLLDFIFQGQSDKTGNSRSFDQHATDVKGVLDLLGIQHATIAGLSYGSLVAQHFAVLYPEYLKQLVLISTFAHKTPYYDAIELAWWRALELGGYSLMLDIMLPSVLSEEYFKNPLIPIDLMKQARQEVNGEKEAMFKLMQATKDREDYRPKLQKIISPTLVIQGEKDLLLPVHLAEEVAKNIKGAQLKVIQNAGHTLNLEAIPVVAKTILEFLG